MYCIKHHTLECWSLQLVRTKGLFLTQCRHPHLTETKGASLGACISCLLWQRLVVEVQIFQTTSKFTASSVNHPY